MNFSSKIFSLLIFTILFFAQSAQAKDEGSAVQDSVFNGIISALESDIEGGSIEARTMQALNVLVLKGVRELEKAGFHEEAAQWRDNWKSGVFSLDLGDHEPLVQWLSDYYVSLEKKLGRVVMSVSGLVDIKIFNHGIPVTFHVNGWRGDDWDMEEYRKHFTPVAGAITYWICYAACTFTAPPLASYGCGTAAHLPRLAMTKFVAPKLSDRVYKKYRKN